MARRAMRQRRREGRVSVPDSRTRGIGAAGRFAWLAGDFGGIVPTDSTALRTVPRRHRYLFAEVVENDLVEVTH